MTNPIVVVQKRSIVWPLLAVAMVAIAGGALFLVYQQMQKQQQPSEIKITQETADKPIQTQPQSDEPPGPRHVMKGSGEETPPPTPDDPPPDNNKGTQVIDPPKKQRPRDHNAAIAEKKPEMVRCLEDHRDGIPQGEIMAAINVAASGKAKSVQLTPAAVDATPLGGCLRNVLLSANYPASDREQIIRLPLKPKT